jgi:hypothetical protein
MSPQHKYVIESLTPKSDKYSRIQEAIRIKASLARRKIESSIKDITGSILDSINSPLPKGGEWLLSR